MSKEQIEALNKALSKLSEEDQAQIVGGNAITDEQCDKIKINLPPDRRTIVAYGGPGWWDDKPDLTDIAIKKPEPTEGIAGNPKASQK